MLDEARRVFDEMPERDLVLWNAMISGYAQMGECYRLASSIAISGGIGMLSSSMF